MSSQHSGNLLNSVTFEEHDGDLNAKKVSIVSGATIYAVVNTGAAGVGNSIVTIANTPLSVSFSGNVTLDVGSKTQIAGNLTLSDPKGFIGLVSVSGFANPLPVTFSGNVTLSDPKTFIGLTTTTLGASPAFVGIVTVANASFPVTQSGTWDEVGINDSGNSITIDGNVGIVGNVTLSDPKTGIGLVSVFGGSIGITGNVTLSDPKGFIGLVTVGGGTVGATFSGNVTLDAGSKTQIVGNVTISDSKGFIGLTTVVQASSARTITGNVTLSDAKTFIGLVTVGGIGTVTLSDPKGFIGLVTVGGIGTVTLADPKGFIGLVSLGGGFANIRGNVTLSDSLGFIGLVSLGGGFANIRGNVTLSDAKTFIGLVTVGGIGTVTLSDPKGFIGLVTIGGISTVTLSDPKGFIGLVTAITKNGGTTKTLANIPLTLSTSSIATIAVPATNLTMYVTNVLVNSDATVRVSIKSGVTYLTGNASIGIVLNPGGGWVESGSPDSPVFIGCPSGALVVEKFDMTGTKANVGGKLVYFSE